jgi:hypothetical protein
MSGVILAYHNFAIPGKLINMTFSEVVRNVRGVFGCGVLMAGGVWLLGIFMPPGWPHWANLVIRVLFGVTLYVMLVHFFKLGAYMELKTLFWGQWGCFFNRKQTL